MLQRADWRLGRKPNLFGAHNQGIFEFAATARRSVRVDCPISAIANKRKRDGSGFKVAQCRLTANRARALPRAIRFLAATTNNVPTHIETMWVLTRHCEPIQGRFAPRTHPAAALTTALYAAALSIADADAPGGQVEKTRRHGRQDADRCELAGSLN